jgi:hypothetical protein
MPDCKEDCQNFLKTISDDPRIKSLLNGITGGTPNIECRPCSDVGPEGNSRAALFNGTPSHIVLCTNRLQSKELKESLTHELVHAYDYSNQRCNFNTCDGLAYSEVRAAREAECNRYFPTQWLKDYCIKDAATRSTKNLYGKDSYKCVDRVFDVANNDIEPISKSM